MFFRSTCHLFFFYGGLLRQWLLLVFELSLSGTTCLIYLARGAKMQMWTRIGGPHLSLLLRNRRYPRRPDMTINIPGLKTPVNMDNNYGLRLTAYYRVSVV